MIVIILILLGIIFYQSRTIEKLNTKIFRLQKELKKYKEGPQNAIEQIKSDVQAIEKTEFIPKQIKEPKPKMDSASSRNLSILITGSILIVLAAIVFLTTAWQTIPDFIKTIVLFLVALVFLGASNLSKEKYHLEKASKTFFYIGMAYLPICLLSISIFGLLGDFLSATGEGKYIYLGASTLVLSVLYYYISKQSNDRYLFYGSLLSQILSVILFTLMFEERIFLVFINLLLYNLLLMLITKDELFNIVEHIIPGVIVVGTCILFEDEVGSWFSILTTLLLSINFIALELKKPHVAKAILFNVFLFVFGFSLIFKESFGFTDGTCQLLATLFTTSVFVLENLIFTGIKNNKNLLMSTRISTLIAMGYIYGGSLFESDKMIIPSYIIALLIQGMLLLDLKSSKNYIYKYLGYAFTNILLIDVNNKVFENTELITYIPMLTTTVIMLYELYSTKERDQFLTIYLAIFETISLCYMGFEGEEVGAILAIVFTVFTLYFNKKTNTAQLFNAVPLLSALPCILDTGLSDDLQLGILLLSSIGLTYLSVTSAEINIYTLLSGIYLFITNDKIDSIYFQEILYLVWGSMHVYLSKNEKTKDLFKCITAVAATALYYSIVEDLELLTYTLFEVLGATICGMYIIRFVVPKYYKNVDVLEYIFWGFVYLYALGNYANSKDGIIFSVLILGVIFFSYYKKFGASFLAGIIAILVNAFALTKEFWFSIPWWIYLLVVGGILVGFAIKNEANENKTKISVGSVLKEIKDKVEKE